MTQLENPLRQTSIRVTTDHELVGRVLRTRQALGDAHIQSLLEREKARRELKGQTLYQRVCAAPANEARLREAQHVCAR